MHVGVRGETGGDGGGEGGEWGNPEGNGEGRGGAAGNAEEKSGETEVGNRKAGLGNGRVGTRPNRGEG